MNNLYRSGLSIFALAAALPAFAPPDAGSGDGSNTITIDLTPAIDAVHAAEAIEDKAETFISHVIDKLLGISKAPAVDVAAVQANVKALADELTAKTSAFSAALAADSGEVDPVPSIASITPTSGPVGTAVTLTGTGFADATAVNFGTVAATDVAVTDDTTITATVPDGGTSDVTVVGPNGTSPATSFTYVPAAS